MRIAMAVLPELVVCCSFLLLSGVLSAPEQKRCVCGWNPEEISLIITSDTSKEQYAKIDPFDRDLPSDIVFLTLQIQVIADNYTLGSKPTRSARLSASKDIPYEGGEQFGTWIATKSRLYSKLSPKLFDSLSLWALGVSSRSNNSVLFLPFPICDDSRASEILHSIIESLLQRLQRYQTDTSEWSIEEYTPTTSLESSQVFLFMSTGLLAVLGTFITSPFVLFAVLPWCCQRHTKTASGRLRPHFWSLFIVSFLFFLTLATVWTVDTYIYYAEDVSSKILFPNFLSPFTINLIFYLLTGLTSFLGGIFFPKCSSPSMTAQNYSLCDRLGLGMLSVILSAGVYHSFFIILALYYDLVTVTAFLVVFGCLLTLLFLGNVSVITQYTRNGFRGFFPLVVTLELIILILYTVSVKAFRSLILGNSCTATSAWLLIAVILSVLALSFSISIFVLVLRQRSNVRSHIGRYDERDMETGVKESQQLVAQRNVATVSPEVQLVMTLQAVVGAWKKSKKKDKNEKN